MVEGHLGGHADGPDLTEVISSLPKGSSGLEVAAVTRGGAVEKGARARRAGIGVGRPIGEGDQCLWEERSDGLLGDGPGRLLPRLLAGGGPAPGGSARLDPIELNR